MFFGKRFLLVQKNQFYNALLSRKIAIFAPSIYSFSVRNKADLTLSCFAISIYVRIFVANCE